ncbi:hypothetical protein [Salmonella enterica]|uniref:hypothetical protein n=1 Tax=Salmonella enterica TaxID=28901 RepID=UPI00109E21DF|nr:hypothetical protein [Salmonella enterica]QCC10075.1 hypothetical protein CVJ36_23405 [Salmonella enterica subsp. enterica serovar Oranienburg]
MDIMEGKTNREKTLYFIFLLLVLLVTTGLLKAYSQKVQPTIEEIKNNMDLLELKVQVCDKEIEMHKIRPNSNEQEKCLDYKNEYKQIRQQYEIITTNNKKEKL